MARPVPARPSRFSENYDHRNRPRARARSKGAMGNMNVTPFIDVLLVLLIMLIMAVPIKVHVAEVGLPSVDCFDCSINSDQNTIAVTQNDKLLWNGVAVTSDQLRAQVAAAAAMPDQPLLRFEPEALASYDLSARTIVLMKESGAERFAFVGNEKYRELD